jgi:ribosomal protein S18 acetylase RimI-like enzyme
VRSFLPADRPAVLELSRRALARPEEQLGNPAWETREELESELEGWDREPHETLFVEEDEGEVIGFGGVEVASGWEHADLFGPLVAEPYRGRKIRSELLEASIEAGRALGAARIMGSIGTRNTNCRILLELAGFRPIEGAQAMFRLTPLAHRPVSMPLESTIVRRGNPEDLAAALALYHECFPEGRFPEAIWQAGLERGTVYLAEETGEILALVDIDPSDRWIYHLGVAENARSRGLGAFLLSCALEDYWEEHPGESLGLSVAADNVPAIRLYRRQGFAPWLVLQTFELTLT